MYRGKTIVQVGAHVGNTENDPIFKEVDETTRIILVEPVPYLFNKLRENYSAKFRDTSNISFVNKAVSNFIGEIELTIPSERNDFSSLPVYASQLASVNPTHATGHIHRLIVDKIRVPTTTVDEIVNEYNLSSIDLLHTDTEGHDYYILMNYSFSVKPRQVLFEHKHIDGLFTVGRKYIELCNKLLSLGYTKKHSIGDDTMFEIC